MRITINGDVLEVPDGSSITVENGRVYVNGQTTEFDKVGPFKVDKIIIDGNAGTVKTDRGSVEVKGDVTGNVQASGSVSCKNVGKGVDAGGSVACGNVVGNIDAGGSVSCGTVQGDIDAGGSVRHG